MRRLPSGEVLGRVRVPSGRMGVFDIGLIGYLPRAALDPMVVWVDVPADRDLVVEGVRVGTGRFSDCWQHVRIVLREDGEPTHATKLGEAAVDFARLVAIDARAIEHWRHDESLDGKADWMCWGRDAAALAKAIGAKRQPDGSARSNLRSEGDRFGWVDLPVAQAEAIELRAQQKKSDEKWLLATDLRPHSHHFAVLAQARASKTGSGSLELGDAGARCVMWFTSWGDGVFPVMLELDAEDRPVAVRIELAPRS